MGRGKRGVSKGGKRSRNYSQFVCETVWTYFGADHVRGEKNSGIRDRRIPHVAQMSPPTSTPNSRLDTAPAAWKSHCPAQVPDEPRLSIAVAVGLSELGMVVVVELGITDAVWNDSDDGNVVEAGSPSDGVTVAVAVGFDPADLENTETAEVVIVVPSDVITIGTVLVSRTIPLLLNSVSHRPTVPIIPNGGFTGPVEAARSKDARRVVKKG